MRVTPNDSFLLPCHANGTGVEAVLCSKLCFLAVFFDTVPYRLFLLVLHMIVGFPITAVKGGLTARLLNTCDAHKCSCWLTGVEEVLATYDFHAALTRAALQV